LGQEVWAISRWTGSDRLPLGLYRTKVSAQAIGKKGTCDRESPQKKWLDTTVMRKTSNPGFVRTAKS
jgi:hypothetical protein